MGEEGREREEGGGTNSPLPFAGTVDRSVGKASVNFPWPGDTAPTPPPPPPPPPPLVDDAILDG